jgi:hypothetical protein
MLRKETDKYSEVEMGRGIGFLELLDQLDRINTSIVNNNSVQLEWIELVQEYSRLYNDAKELSIDNVTAPLDSAEEVTLIRLRGGQSDDPNQLVKSFITVVKNGVKYTGEGYTIATVIKDVLLKMGEHLLDNVISLREAV